MWQISKSILVIILLLPIAAKAQIDEQLIQEIVEYLLETSEEELDFTDLQEDLMGRLQKPLQLNKAGFDDFKSLGFLTESEILAIINHREIYGDFLGSFELQSVEGLAADKVHILVNFVTCIEYMDEEKTTLTKVLNESKGEFIIRYRTIFEDQEGYSLDSNGQKDYAGSQYQLFNRLSYRYKNKISFGYTAEKDMGEEFFKGSQKTGFDFYSAHIYAIGLGIIKQLALGDFQVQFGQGLTMWSGLSFSKSADALNVVRRPRKISPFRSVNENQFLRGAGITLGKGKTELSLFYSKKKIDGNVVQDTLDWLASFFTALQLSGFHRTQKEIDSKSTIEETIAGGSFEVKIKDIRIGITQATYQYNPGLQKDLRPYQKLDFIGESLSNTGFYYHGLLGKMYIFGETALANFNAQSLSTINGAIIPLTNKIEMASIYRNYSPSYNSLYAAPFRELSKAKNEIGLYTGFNVKFRDDLTLKLYLDRFKFPWLKYQTDLPSVGYEYLAELQYKPSKNFNLYGRIKTQIREQNLPDNESPLNILKPLNTTHYRFQFSYKVNRVLSATSRAELATYKIDHKNNATGVLLFQDIAFKPFEKPYSVMMRYAVFNVDDYAARIYAYENDVLYAYSIPAYQGQGYRFYLLARIKLKRSIDLWVRYSQTTYFDRNEISSGGEKIMGNTRSDLKLQARIRF